MHSDNDEDYVDSPEELELDPNVFHIWDPLQKPVTLQYTTEQLHSENAALCTPQGILMFQNYAEMIHEGDIDLDPEYQRGQYPTLIFLHVDFLSPRPGCPCSCSMVRQQADGHHRFVISQLLRATCCLCHL